MKKRILFLISNLETGGVSKSMVSLLNTIDRQKYDVSLWIASPHGVLFSQIPKEVKIFSDQRITALSGGYRLRLFVKARLFTFVFGKFISHVFNKGF